MKTIAIISQKGGAGKTTLTVHLAVVVAHTGRNVAVIDLDPQASAANWSDRRTTDLPVVLSAHASRLLHEMKRVERMGGEVLFLDTAPHSDSTALEAARASDLVLIPCRPAILDLEAITSTLALIRTTGTPVCVVLNAVAPVGQDTAQATEALVDLQVEVCPVRLGNRVAFSRSLIAGQTAQELEPGGKAAVEMERLHDFVCNRVHLCTTSNNGVGTNAQSVRERA